MVMNSDSRSLKKMVDEMWLQDNPEFRFRPASVLEFILDPYYLGLEGEVFKRVMIECEKILDGGYTEVIDYEGYSSGKSFKSSILLLYKAHQLLCLKYPHGYLGLSQDKNIVLLNMGLSLNQARDVVFQGISSMVSESPFFKQFGMEILSDRIRFKKDKIAMICGSSSKTVALGLNVFCAILDEAAFYVEQLRSKTGGAGEGQDHAEMLYSQIKRRINSRFKKDKNSLVKPLICLISSPKHEEDFMNKKIKEVKHLGLKNTYVINLPTWLAKDRDRMSDDVFLFDRENYRIMNDREIQNFVMDGKVYDISPTKRNKEKLLYGNKLDERVWIIPVDLQEDFEKSPELSARDYGAIPSNSLERFFRRPQEIEKCMYVEIQNRFTPKSSLSEFDFDNPTEDLTFIHVDLGLNKIRADGSRGDFAGFAVCHFGGFDNEHGGRPIIIFDAVARIGAGSDREVEFSSIVELILEMKRRGWNIYKTTFDSYQCLEKSTLIPIASGIKGEYNPNMPLKSGQIITGLSLKNKRICEVKEGDYVYSSKEDGEICCRRVKAAWCSGKKVIWRITLDNGEFIDCSDNHPFMMRDGTYVEAKLLKPRDSLMPFYRCVTPDGYLRVRDMKSGKNKLEHRLVKGCPKGMAVHHIDEDKMNNDPSNLEIMGHGSHSKLHWTAERREETSKRTAEANTKNWTEKRRKEASKRMTEANIKNSSIISERMKKNHPMKNEETRKKVGVSQKKRWADPKYREKMSKRPVYRGEDAGNFNSSVTWEMIVGLSHLKCAKVAKILGVHHATISKRVRAKGYKGWKDFQESPKNHKVVKVECLGIEDEVWDIEVEGIHNFALKAGVFVHNSVSSIQTLQKNGIVSDIISTVRTPTAYETLKAAIYEKRVFLPEHQILLEELKQLERHATTDKIDHPRYGTSDVADAVAASLYNCSKFYGTKHVGVPFREKDAEIIGQFEGNGQIS